MKITLKIFFSLILIFNFQMIGIGQIRNSDKSLPVVIPEQVMEQVIRRILTWYFKPRNQAKVIYLAKGGFQQSWLPVIKNIEFRLLSAEEIQQRDTGVYFFTDIEQVENQYSVGFAFGNPGCVYQGDNWHFRFSPQRVRLWENGQVGGSCSSSP